MLGAGVRPSTVANKANQHRDMFSENAPPNHPRNTSKPPFALNRRTQRVCLFLRLPRFFFLFKETNRRKHNLGVRKPKVKKRKKQQQKEETHTFCVLSPKKAAANWRQVESGYRKRKRQILNPPDPESGTRRNPSVDFLNGLDALFWIHASIFQLLWSRIGGLLVWVLWVVFWGGFPCRQEAVQIKSKPPIQENRIGFKEYEEDI